MSMENPLRYGSLENTISCENCQVPIHKQDHLLIKPSDTHNVKLTSDTRLEDVPDSYLACSILACIFCFCACPLGLIAICVSLDVKDAISSRDLSRARNSSGIAKSIIIATILLGITVILLISIPALMFNT